MVSNSNGGNNVDTGKNNDFKVEGTNVITEPNTTAEKIKEKYSNAVIKKDGQEIKSGFVGTGFTVTVDGTVYTIIKKGDINGDGQVKANDYVLIKNSIMGSSNLEGTSKSGADVNGDGQVKANDYVLIKNFIMNPDSNSISIK